MMCFREPPRGIVKPGGEASLGCASYQVRCPMRDASKQPFQILGLVGVRLDEPVLHELDEE